jgi:thiaminase
LQNNTELIKHEAMNVENMTLVMIPKEAWTDIVAMQQDILRKLQELSAKETNAVPIKYITAKEFMAAVRIGRTKFDQLVQTSKIRTTKKRRKIYVPVSEVERYFTDVSIL